MAAIKFLCAEHGAVNIHGRGHGAGHDGWRPEPREQQRGEEKEGNREILREGPRCGWKTASRGALINHQW